MQYRLLVKHERWREKTQLKLKHEVIEASENGRPKLEIQNSASLTVIAEASAEASRISYNIIILLAELIA